MENLPPPPPPPNGSLKTVNESTDPKILAVQQLIMASPPGEADAVLHDIQRMLGNENISDAVLCNIFHDYNCKTFRLVDTGSYKMILHEAGEVDSSHFLDPSSCLVRQIDHISGGIIGEGTPWAQQSALEPIRSALQAGLEGYLASQYTGPHVEFGAGCFEAPASKGSSGLVLALRAERINLRNLWSGAWQAEYFLPLVPCEESGSTLMTGSIQIHGHYFDEGNIQLQTRKGVFPAQVNFTDIQSLVNNVIAQIKAAETSLQEALEVVYTNMSEETLKSIRRTLPKTRSKMNWNINQLKLRGNLKR